MSTRSLVAMPTEGGKFVGRYCHWDGYPTCRGSQLFELYDELDGDIAAMREYAIRPGQKGYWSAFMTPSECLANDILPENVPCDICDGSGVRPVSKVWTKRDQERSGCNGCQRSGRMSNPKRVDGFVTDDSELIASDDDNWGTAWAYVIDEDGLYVYVAGGGYWTRVGFERWGSAPDWRAYER